MDRLPAGRVSALLASAVLRLVAVCLPELTRRYAVAAPELLAEVGQRREAAVLRDLGGGMPAVCPTFLQYDFMVNYALCADLAKLVQFDGNHGVPRLAAAMDGDLALQCVAAGIGSPHTGRRAVWPLVLVTLSLASDSDAEVAACLPALMASAAATGLVHESFDADAPHRHRRPWFAWATAMFAELERGTRHGLQCCRAFAPNPLPEVRPDTRTPPTPCP